MSPALLILLILVPESVPFGAPGSGSPITEVPSPPPIEVMKEQGPLQPCPLPITTWPRSLIVVNQTVSPPMLPA